MIGRVIVPGIGGSDEAHWQTLWQKQWEAESVRTEPESWSQPNLDDWVAATDRAVRALAPRVDGIVLVAHSLGCWAVSEWLLRAPDEIPIAAFLAAPPDPKSDAFPTTDASTFAAAHARPLPAPSMVIASTNDPYCEPQVAKRVAAAWESDFVAAGEVGHINSASGLGMWMAGREALERLDSRLGLV